MMKPMKASGGRPFQRCMYHSSASRGKEQGPMTVFDRQAKRLQRDRAAAAPDTRDYDYIHREIAARLTERLQVLLPTHIHTSARRLRGD